MAVSDLEPEHDDDFVDGDLVATRFDVAQCMAAEIMFENDEHALYGKGDETPEERWVRMRAWVGRHITPEVSA